MKYNNIKIYSYVDNNLYSKLFDTNKEIHETYNKSSMSIIIRIALIQYLQNTAIDEIKKDIVELKIKELQNNI